MLSVYIVYLVFSTGYWVPTYTCTYIHSYVRTYHTICAYSNARLVNIVHTVHIVNTVRSILVNIVPYRTVLRAKHTKAKAAANHIRRRLLSIPLVSEVSKLLLDQVCTPELDKLRPWVQAQWKWARVIVDTLSRTHLRSNRQWGITAAEAVTIQKSNISILQRNVFCVWTLKHSRHCNTWN